MKNIGLTTIKKNILTVSYNKYNDLKKVQKLVFELIKISSIYVSIIHILYFKKTKLNYLIHRISTLLIDIYTKL